MEGGAATDLAENARERILVVDRKIAGGGASEDLDSGRAFESLERGQLVDILLGGADKKRDGAMHTVRNTQSFVGQGFRCGRGGLGVRHLEHGSDAAEYSRPA